MTAEERFQSELRTRLGEARNEYDPLMEALSDVPMYRDYEPDSGMDLEMTGLANIGTALRRGLRRLGGGEPVSEMMGRSDELRRYIRELERRRDSLPPGPYSLTSPRDSGDVPRMQEGGFAEGGVIRMQPGGLAGVSTNLSDFGVDEFSGLPRSMTDPTAPRTGRPQLMLDDTRRLLEEGQDLSDAERRALEARIATMEAIGEGGGLAGDVIQSIDDAVADAYALTGRVAGAGIEGLGLGASAILGAEVGAPIIEFGENVYESMDPIAEEGFIPGVAGDRPEDDEDTAPVQEDFTFGDAPVGSLPAEPREPRLTFGENLTATEEDLLPIRSELSFGDLEAQREGTSAPATTGGAAALPSSDDLFEQDKWLALAQFGLGLMSSQAPTFGQALGEAGATGIAALRQAREDQQARATAAQARADRLAAAAARAASDSEEYPYRQVDDFIELAKLYQDRAKAIVDANNGFAPQQGEPGYAEYIDAIARSNAAISESARLAESR